MTTYKFEVYKIQENSDNVMYISSINIFDINRLSVDAKNKSEYIPIPDGSPIWINYGPEYIKIRISASYEGINPIKLEPNLLLMCSSNTTDLPEFDHDSGYWRIMSYNVKRSAKTSNIVSFDAELMLYMNDQESWK